MLSDLRYRLRALFQRQTVEAELEEELRFHVGRQTEKYVQAGANPEEAVRRARIELGGVEQAKEECREARGVSFIETTIRDLRYGLRQYRRSAGFTIVVILTLALGIGANTAIFSIVNGVLLNPLPYPHPDQLVSVSASTPRFETSSISYPDYLDWARDNRSFSSLAAYRSFQSFQLIGRGGPERISAVEVTSNFFPTLGVTPVLGRNFTKAEDQLGGPPAVILSSGFWKSKFASSLLVIGTTLNLDGADYIVEGVLPAKFYFCCEDINFRPGDVYVPLGADDHPWMRDRKFHSGTRAVGRIKPGVTVGQARADMDRVAQTLAAQFPDADKGLGISVVPLKQAMVKDVEPSLLVLLAAVGFVLLITCVNVANLLLARSAGRAREFAIRAALGAGKRHVIRQKLTESGLLALTGGVLGLLLAEWGTSAGLSILPSALPRAEDVRTDPHVLLFTLAISLFAGILSGLAPAVKTSPLNLHEALKEGGRGQTTAHTRTQGAFIVVEMALGVVLLIGAGLTIRTLVELLSVNPGFDPQNVLSFTVELPPSLASGNPAQIRASLRQITAKIASVPGVAAVSPMAGALPMSGDNELPFWLEGTPKPPNENSMPEALWYIVGPDYLQAMRIPLLRGRFITPQDDANTPAVCVIDENFASKYFPRQDPIGRYLDFDMVYNRLEVVGVVGHVKQFGLDESGGSPVLEQFYTSQFQLPDALTSFTGNVAGYVARTSGSPEAFAASISQAVQGFNSETVVYGVQPMEHIVSRSLATRRFAMILLAAFATVALLLSAIGIYGVISYVFGRRMSEIGIRMALGAQQEEVLRLVLGRGARLALIGVGLGTAAALILMRFLSGLLFGVKPTDPLTFTVVSLILVGIALAACYIPARRAMRIDPATALRHE